MNYEQLLRHVLINGRAKSNRTGTGTRSIFGHQMRFNMRDGFPLVTTKKVHTRSVIAELLWFLSGSTNTNDLDATIWDEWADAKGDLGPIYGHQWRRWYDGQNGADIDQIAELVQGLQTNPTSRRHIVSAWHVADEPYMALAPCHALFQCHCEELTTRERVSASTKEQASQCCTLACTVTDDLASFDAHCTLDQVGVPKYRLSLQLYQRSADLFLGVPFNIASYSLLLHMLAQQCNMVPGDFIWTGGDCHIYDNHLDQVALQLSRTPYPYPQLHIKRKPESIFDYKIEDFEFVGYQHHPAIAGKVAI